MSSISLNGHGCANWVCKEKHHSPFIHGDACHRSFLPQCPCNLIDSDLWWLSPLPLTMIKIEYVAVHSVDWQNSVIQRVCWMCAKWKYTCTRLHCNDCVHLDVFMWCMCVHLALTNILLLMMSIEICAFMCACICAWTCVVKCVALSLTSSDGSALACSSR